MRLAPLYLSAWRAYRAAPLPQRLALHAGTGPILRLLPLHQDWLALTPVRFDPELPPLCSTLPSALRLFVPSNVRERLQAGWCLHRTTLADLLPLLAQRGRLTLYWSRPEQHQWFLHWPLPASVPTIAE